MIRIEGKLNEICNIQFYVAAGNLDGIERFNVIKQSHKIWDISGKKCLNWSYLFEIVNIGQLVLLFIYYCMN